MYTIDELEDITDIPVGTKVILVRKGHRYNEKELIIKVSENK